MQKIIPLRWFVGIIVGVIIIVEVAGLAVFYISNKASSPPVKPNSIPSLESSPQNSTSPQLTTSTEKLITANPLDLSQIQRISKFRSCVGHDSVAENSKGEPEPIRSMKHYIDSGNFKVGSSKKIKAYAPFDGTITLVREEGGELGYEVSLTSPKMPAGWLFSFFHLDLLPSLKIDSTVRAGELIGYQNSGVTYFDIAIRMFADKNTGKPFSSLELRRLSESKDIRVTDIKHVYAPVFDHMTTEVLHEYEKRGVTQQSSIIPKADRDANPCICQGGVDKPECFFKAGFDNNSQWIYLK